MLRGAPVSILNSNSVVFTLHLMGHVSLPVAVPTPEEKWEGGNVYKKLTQIVFCDVTVIYDVENKLSFWSGIWNIISDKDLRSNQSRARRTI